MPEGAPRPSVQDALYRLMVDACPDPMILLVDEVIHFVNHAASRWLGAENTDELVGRRAADFLRPESGSPHGSWQDQFHEVPQCPGVRGARLTRVHPPRFVVEARTVSVVWEGYPATLIVLRPDGTAMADEGTPSAVSAAATGSAMKTALLLVEDEEELLLCQRALTRTGYRVHVARDGREALARFREHQSEIRMIVTDINMPLMDGWQLSLQIRKLQRDVRILFVTGGEINTSPQVRVRDSGEELLGKPFTINRLLAKVKEMLENEKRPA